MDTKEISAEDALVLASRQEDHFFDKKSALIKGAKLQKAAVAFANADGGEICIGIADDAEEADSAKRWQGVAHIEEYNQHIQALTEVQPSLPMELSFLRAENTIVYILRIQIEKSQAVHKTADGTVYVR
jgi:ATP-dependent DNA helicase RecG